MKRRIDTSTSLECHGELSRTIERALENIRPALQADAGDIQLVSVENGIVKVRLTGACGGCAMAGMTMTQGVEQAIRKAVPEVKKVVAV